MVAGPPGKMYWTKLKIIGQSLKMLGPSQKILTPLVIAGYGPGW